MNNKKKSGGRRSKKNGPRGRNGTLTSGGGASVNATLYEPWMPLFPASITKRLRYSTSFATASTAGAITSTQVFRANDLFDPDFTGTGHQPMGFDQLMTWYNHFVVVSAKITCIFKGSAANSGPMTVCIRIDGDSTPITVIDRIVEIGGCVTADLEMKGGYGSCKKLSLLADICKLQGVSRGAITSDPSLQGNAAAAPAEVTYFHITSWDSGGVSSASEVDVILEQVAVFLEPRDITES
jgi:hypothetical protein